MDFNVKSRNDACAQGFDPIKNTPGHFSLGAFMVRPCRPFGNEQTGIVVHGRDGL